MRLTNSQYAEVFDRTSGLGVVRACVDLVVTSQKGIALVKRSIPPQVGAWHLPGGKIESGESFEEFAARTAHHDLGIEVEIVGAVGGMNFPAEKSTMEIDGVECEIIVHSMSVVLHCRAKSLDIRGSAEWKNVGWFTAAPIPAHSIHIPWLLEHSFFTPA